MPYLIDGHNLIPRVPGLSLRNIDDELELVERLKTFSQHSRRAIEVFFDGAPPGKSGMRRFGQVTARFVQQGRTADEAIRRRLDQLGKSASGWTVVSSDHQVQAEARAHGAQVITSENFARTLSEIRLSRRSDAEDRPALSGKELDDWLDLFGGDDRGKSE